jgi:hypothetical protein
MPIYQRDPRLPRVLGGEFGVKSSTELDILSSANIFFCKSGTHRTMYGERFTNGSKTLALPRKPFPGPGVYRTISTLGFAEKPKTGMKWNFQLKVVKEPDFFDGTRTRYRSLPAISFTRSLPPRNTWHTPGPAANAPVCGYTSVS